MRNINEIIIHCTDTPYMRETSVKDVDSWHRQQGWSGIGYHFLVGLDGKVSSGRPLEKIGAHAKGHNAKSIGICYVGGRDVDGRPSDTRTILQEAALRDLLLVYKTKFPEAVILGHNDVDKNKACPCFDAKKEYEELGF